ncbi:L-threonine dehydratase biosynthetic IlvA [Jannaschia seosinensis]|uniref:L-threonine dehydratase n=1 Tax=Jannaschia seosinensis TaxID=313367 RepID=A0A0M7BG01_9RHOB|nr:threonine ammonia-lyase IlvA [Jannaschia seosinensis]CUH40712.1 L-threonine dehydratase biosynthetic IlvA [Jannaschia seosinensis]
MTDFAAGAEAATAAMRDLFAPTPCARNDYLSDRFGADIWLKREDLTPVRSYKLRGAFNAMRKLPGGRVACASAGNHAQGVAWMCRHLGVAGTIFMPVTTPGQKIDKTRLFGGEHVEIVLTGDFFDATLAAAQAHCAETGAHFLSPFDDDRVIEGQASVAVEMLEQCGGPPDMLVVPVGGGGLSAGMRAYLRAVGQMPEMRYVEPAGGASFSAALAHGGPVTLDALDGFVDGAAVARIGVRPFEILRDVSPDHLLRVPENRICITIQELLNTEGIVLEPAGALAVDALRDLAPEIAGRRVVCVTTGGNFDFERLPEVKERAMRFAGLKKYYVLRMPQRPGALRDFLDILGPGDDIARFEYLKKSARNFGSVLIGIETTEPESFARLEAEMDRRGFAWRDLTADPTLADLLI